MLPLLTHEARFPGQPHLAANMGHALPDNRHVDQSAPLVVQVNSGRWIVQCDECNGAQFAHITDRRFFCTECQNAQQGGAWRPVIWPGQADVEAITSLLEVRPHRGVQHWHPDRNTVADLRKDNRDHGVAG